MTERKYSLMKIAAGDYLLPSNNRQKLWRLYRYVDGTDSGLDSGPRAAHYWAVSQWTGDVDETAVAESIVDQDWGQWEWHAGHLPSRADAITEAMRLSDG